MLEEAGKVTGSAPAALNRQHVDQTGLNQNRGPRDAPPPTPDSDAVVSVRAVSFRGRPGLAGADPG